MDIKYRGEVGLRFGYEFRIAQCERPPKSLQNSKPVRKSKARPLIPLTVAQVLVARNRALECPAPQTRAISHCDLYDNEKLRCCVPTRALGRRTVCDLCLAKHYKTRCTHAKRDRQEQAKWGGLSSQKSTEFTRTAKFDLHELSPLWEVLEGSGSFPICSGMLRGFSRFVPFHSFSSAIKSTYRKEQSQKGPQHNLDLSRKSGKPPQVWKPPGLASPKRECTRRCPRNCPRRLNKAKTFRRHFCLKRYKTRCTPEKRDQIKNPRHGQHPERDQNEIGTRYEHCII